MNRILDVRSPMGEALRVVSIDGVEAQPGRTPFEILATLTRINC